MKTLKAYKYSRLKDENNNAESFSISLPVESSDQQKILGESVRKFGRYFLTTICILGAGLTAGFVINDFNFQGTFNFNLAAFRYQEVWEHSQTLGILTFDGRGFLTHCELILAEKERSYKIYLLDSLSLKYPIRPVDFYTMLNIVHACEDLQPMPEAPTKTPAFNQPISYSSLMSGIVPGTKWCGFNDIADSYHDLGPDFKLDKCCRAHDHCPIKIKAFSKNFGAWNTHPYTKSHCSCDALFFECLKEAGTETASSIGNIFFNVLSLQCAEPVYPKVCVEQRKKDKGEIASSKGNRVGKSHVVSQPDGGQNHVGSTSMENRLFFNFFRNTQTQEEIECVRWIEDREGVPKLKFRLPNKKF